MKRSGSHLVRLHVAQRGRALLRHDLVLPAQVQQAQLLPLGGRELPRRLVRRHARVPAARHLPECA